MTCRFAAKWVRAWSAKKTCLFYCFLSLVPWCRYTLAEDIPEGHVTLQYTPMIPNSDGMLVYDFYYDMAKDKWRPWGDTIDATPIPPDAKFKKISIPSVDTVSVLMQCSTTDLIGCTQAHSQSGGPIEVLHKQS